VELETMQKIKTTCVLAITMAAGCEYPGSANEDSWRMWSTETEGGMASSTTMPMSTSTTTDEADESSGSTADVPEDTCELPTCEGEATCIPRNLYGQVAAGEYYNECRNYCFADDHCFDRASAMLGAMNDACDKDLRGPDGAWCDEFNPPNSTGTCDDLVYKVVIRYPAGETWTYHIATLVNTCEDGLCMIDPIGQPGGSPTTTCRSAEDWCDAFAHGDTVVWADTDNLPPAGTVYCEIVPGDQEYFDDDSVVDPTDGPAIDGVCRSLEVHVASLCAAGRQPFPPGCGMDRDNDGVPDAYDECPDSPAGADVDYCDPARLGCADDEGPGGTGGTTGTTGTTGTASTTGPVPAPDEDELTGSTSG
jgi:hypothetical protein